MEIDNSPSINVKVLRDQLDRLSSVKDIPISQLNEGLLDDFTALTYNINSLIGTDGYNLLFKEIQQKFPQNSLVKPGTVAGYFMGCFIPSNFKYGNNCSLACLTGAPNFYDSAEGIPCKKNVYIAPFDGEYQLTKLSSNTDDKTAIVYIQPPFHGFSKSEVEQLKSDGIDEIVFSYYEDHKKDYYTSDSLGFSKINIRSDTNASIKRAAYGIGSSSNGTSSIGSVLLFVILLLIAIYAIWNMRNN